MPHRIYGGWDYTPLSERFSKDVKLPLLSSSSKQGSYQRNPLNAIDTYNQWLPQVTAYHLAIRPINVTPV